MNLCIKKHFDLFFDWNEFEQSSVDCDMIKCENHHVAA